MTQKEYEKHYLRAEFKWGEKTYPPRDGKARDSGIQYNITGPLKVWPRMMEFQINEGGTGDMWVVGGTGATVDGKVYESASSGPGAYIRIPHIGRGPLVNVIGHRDPVNDLERPHGKWNVLELVVDHDRILYFVNGKLALLGTKANTTKGKILFQCEGSEVYFRKMKIAMLREWWRRRIESPAVSGYCSVSTCIRPGYSERGPDTERGRAAWNAPWQPSRTFVKRSSRPQVYESLRPPRSIEDHRSCVGCSPFCLFRKLPPR